MTKQISFFIKARKDNESEKIISTQRLSKELSSFMYLSKTIMNGILHGFHLMLDSILWVIKNLINLFQCHSSKNDASVQKQLKKTGDNYPIEDVSMLPEIGAEIALDQANLDQLNREFYLRSY